LLPTATQFEGGGVSLGERVAPRLVAADSDRNRATPYHLRRERSLLECLGESDLRRLARRERRVRVLWVHRAVGTKPAIAKAAASGNSSLVSRLLKHDFAPERGFAHSIAIRDAARNGHEQVIRLIMASGLQPEAIAKAAGPALAEATRNAHSAIMRLFLKEVGEVNRALFCEKNIVQAVKGGHSAVVRLLLEGISVSESGLRAYAEALLQAGRDESVEMIRLFSDNVRMPPLFVSQVYETALFEAVHVADMSERWGIVAVLLQWIPFGLEGKVRTSVLRTYSDKHEMSHQSKWLLRRGVPSKLSWANTGRLIPPNGVYPIDYITEEDIRMARAGLFGRASYNSI